MVVVSTWRECSWIKLYFTEFILSMVLRLGGEGGIGQGRGRVGHRGRSRNCTVRHGRGIVHHVGWNIVRRVSPERPRIIERHGFRDRNADQGEKNLRSNSRFLKSAKNYDQNYCFFSKSFLTKTFILTENFYRLNLCLNWMTNWN